MGTYKIFKDLRIIEPPKPVNRIYNGNALIWERMARQAGIVIEKVFEDMDLENKLFNKNGIIMPGSIMGGDTAVFFTLRGTKAKILITSELDYTTIIEPDVPGQDYDGEIASAVYSDDIFYSVHYQGKNYDTYKQTKYLKFSDDLKMATTGNFSPEITDTKEQWVAYTGRNINPPYSAELDGIAGNNIYPFSNVLGGLAGHPSLSTLCYMQNNTVVTNKSYAVIAVFQNSMICAENISVTNCINATITERDFAGNLLHTWAQNIALTDESFNPLEYGISLFYKINDNLLGYTKNNLPYVINKTGEIYQPPIFTNAESIYAVCNPKMVLATNFIYYEDGNAVKSALIRDNEGFEYEIANSLSSPGNHYVSNDGWIYFIGTTPLDSPEPTKFALLRARYWG